MKDGQWIAMKDTEVVARGATFHETLGLALMAGHKEEKLRIAFERVIP